MRYVALLCFCVFLFGCDDEDLYADGSPWVPVEERDVPLLRNDALRQHPYLRRQPTTAQEWTRFIQTLNGQNINLNPETFTPTWSGFSSAPVGDLSYVDLGDFAIIFTNSSRTNTSNATSLSLTGVPEAIRSATAAGTTATCFLLDNGSSTWGMVNIDDAGGMQFFIFTGTAPLPFSDSGFTNIGSKGLPAGFFVMYPK